MGESYKNPKKKKNHKPIKFGKTNASARRESDIQQTKNGNMQSASSIGRRSMFMDVKVWMGAHIHESTWLNPSTYLRPDRATHSSTRNSWPRLPDNVRPDPIPTCHRCQPETRDLDCMTMFDLTRFLRAMCHASKRVRLPFLPKWRDRIFVNKPKAKSF